MVSWSGSLDLPTALPPRLPGGNPDWRVVVEEWEALPADPGLGGERRRVGTRIVYTSCRSEPCPPAAIFLHVARHSALGAGRSLGFGI